MVIPVVPSAYSERYRFYRTLTKFANGGIRRGDRKTPDIYYRPRKDFVSAVYLIIC